MKITDFKTNKLMKEFIQWIDLKKEINLNISEVQDVLNIFNIKVCKSNNEWLFYDKNLDENKWKIDDIFYVRNTQWSKSLSEYELNEIYLWHISDDMKTQFIFAFLLAWKIKEILLNKYKWNKFRILIMWDFWEYPNI